jgi:hypothetical protein
MNREHLGDAYDFWKRAMLGILRKPRRRIKIMPMVTDKKWTKPEIGTYRTLLGARTDELVLQNFDRKEGFPPQSPTGAKKWKKYNLFLDPDTGIENKKSKKSGKRRERSGTNKSPKSVRYLKHSDLEDLLGETNVVAVYQHAPREKEGWLRKKLNKLNGRRRNGIKAVGYEAGRVGMIFATRNEERSREILEGLKKLAGPTAKGRVFPNRKKRPS